MPDLREPVAQGQYRDGMLELDAYMFWGALMAAGDYMAFQANPW